MAARVSLSQRGTRRNRRDPAPSSTAFHFGEYKSAIASRHNDDGTTSFITITPGLEGFEFVVGDRAGKPILTIRDAQHEYVFE